MIATGEPECGNYLMNVIGLAHNAHGFRIFLIPAGSEDYEDTEKDSECWARVHVYDWLDRCMTDNPDAAIGKTGIKERFKEIFGNHSRDDVLAATAWLEGNGYVKSEGLPKRKGQRFVIGETLAWSNRNIKEFLEEVERTCQARVDEYGRTSYTICSCDHATSPVLAE